MTRERGIRIFALAVLCIITFFVNNHIINTDIMESRNIITAREMVYDGNWIIPTMNGELRLEKPPLPTWITAVAEIITPDSISMQRGMAAMAAILLVAYFYIFASHIMKTDAIVPTLLLCTCYNIILMGRTASWDIYCHAFMMAAIYHTARALTKNSVKYKHFIIAGIWCGLSIMSKGPVSPYALLLPFIIAFVVTARPNTKRHIPAIITSVFIALVIGSWWYIYVNITCADTLHAVIQKESGSWINHNVRAWYYYWKFFLETGVWSLMLITAIFLPLKDKQLRKSKNYLMPLIWLTASLVLLSLLPEKKTRYLLPVLIPACYLMGTLINHWKTQFEKGIYTSADKLSMRLNTLLIAIATLILPIAAWTFLYKPELISLTELVFTGVISVAFSILLTVAAVKLRPQMMLFTVTAMFLTSECLALPMISKVINNPERKSIAMTRDMKAIEGLPFYHDKSEPLRIELVYAANRKIKEIDIKNREILLKRLPCVVLTHNRISEMLPQSTLQGIDTVYIGKFDDNRRPKGTRRYSDEFIYNVTMLKLHK
ncbi:MAG: ArnT family glycosyltransferase [Prevotella sp.]